MILFFLGSVGAKLMNLNKVSLLRRFLFSASALIWGSVFFAFIFIKGYEDTFIYLGGQHGYYISEMFITNIGIPGTILLLLGSFLIIAIFTSKKTIPFFWIPAHTITFLLAPQYQVLFAALLGVMLGILLSVAAVAGRK